MVCVYEIVACLKWYGWSNRHPAPRCSIGLKLLRAVSLLAASLALLYWTLPDCTWRPTANKRLTPLQNDHLQQEHMPAWYDFPPLSSDEGGGLEARDGRGWNSERAGQVGTTYPASIPGPTTNYTLTIGIITHKTLQDPEYSTGTSSFSACAGLEVGQTCKYVAAYSTPCPECDALLFRPFHLSPNDTLPTYHPPQQKWVLLETESPQRTWNTHRLSLDIWDQFNVTMTFTADADIQYSRFGNFRCYKNNTEPKVKNYASDTRKTSAVRVIWIVSNCNNTSGREYYVEELQRYIPVDVYGGCGKGPTCGTFATGNVQCLKTLISKYKFFLAFENSFCDGYYTEKAQKTIRMPVVPVVMGMVDYGQLLTSGTFLDVRDFKSPRHLADYLKYLDRNQTAYNEYVMRRKKVRCEKVTPGPPHCQLCAYLHKHRKRKQKAPDIRKFWGSRERCQSPQLFFRGIADEVLKHYPLSKI